MPPICYHLAVADEVIRVLRSGLAEDTRGSFYLGSTAPDMRFFIGATREDTHFMSLDSEEGISGARNIFDVHPALAEKNSMSAQTRAFIAGYLSHLVTDEAWIFDIYRPHFGRSSPMGGDAMANLFDRLLQFELDRRERLNSDSISSIRRDLMESASSVDVCFLDSKSLDRWQEFVFMATTRKANWEGFRNFAERYLIWMRQISRDRIDHFFDTFDDRLAQVLETVPEETIRGFREKAISESIRVVEEYIG